MTTLKQNIIIVLIIILVIQLLITLYLLYDWWSSKNESKSKSNISNRIKENFSFLDTQKFFEQSNEQNRNGSYIGSDQSKIICARRIFSDDEGTSWENSTDSGVRTWYSGLKKCITDLDTGYGTPNAQMVCGTRNISGAEVEKWRTSLKPDEKSYYKVYTDCVTDYEAGAGSPKAQKYCSISSVTPDGREVHANEVEYWRSINEPWYINHYSKCVDEYDNGSGSKEAQLHCSANPPGAQNGRYIPANESYQWKSGGIKDQLEYFYNTYKPCVDNYDSGVYAAAAVAADAAAAAAVDENTAAAAVDENTAAA